MDVINSIQANIISCRNVLLNGNPQEHIVDCIQYVVDNSSFFSVESTRKILDFCLKEVLLQIHSSDFL